MKKKSFLKKLSLLTAAVLLFSAMTLGTAAESVTATTTSGVFTVTDVDEANGTACGFFK